MLQFQVHFLDLVPLLNLTFSTERHSLYSAPHAKTLTYILDRQVLFMKKHTPLQMYFHSHHPILGSVMWSLASALQIMKLLLEFMSSFWCQQKSGTL